MSSTAPASGTPSQSTPTRFGLKHVAIVSFAAWAVALGATLAFATGGVRIGLLAGLVAGFVGSVLGLVLLGVALGKPEVKANDLMQAQVLGFLGRVLIVAVGLVTAQRAGGDAIAFALGFFALFFGVSLLEAVVVFGRSGAAPATPGTDGSKTDV